VRTISLPLEIILLRTSFVEAEDESGNSRLDELVSEESLQLSSKNKLTKTRHTNDRLNTVEFIAYITCFIRVSCLRGETEDLM
jgi:hypothetical protein